MQQRSASADARISTMPAIRNIGGAVTRLTRICTERKAGYTGGRYAGNEERAWRESRARMQLTRVGIRTIAAPVFLFCSLSLSLSFPETYRINVFSYVVISLIEILSNSWSLGSRALVLDFPISNIYLIRFYVRPKCVFCKKIVKS